MWTGGWHLGVGASVTFASAPFFCVDVERLPQSAMLIFTGTGLRRASVTGDVFWT